MNKWLCGTVLGLACLTIPGGMVPRHAAAVQNEPVWHSDYEAARKLARDSGKPLFVVFR